ncbi:MAG: 3-hydroxyacyl-ACP dehydratase FabZ [Thermodesulfobacteriota bacterium]|nr:3-hydroxyacyl-ACP dehydratase FabZ [Thermodesulfobacteriota bacterium]
MEPVDIKKILALLPQRYPFVMIDRVVDVVPNDRITAIKNVSACEPWSSGHFPDNPIMPGVLIVEAMCQAGGLLVNLSGEEAVTGEARYLTGLDKVRFRKRIVPGDTITIYARIIKKKLNMVKIEATAEVGGERAAEAQIMASLGGVRDTSDSNS